MLTSSALVLMMTAPGPGAVLWWFGAAQERAGTMMHSFLMMALITVIWAFFPDTVWRSGKGSAYIGSFTQFAFLDGVERLRMRTTRAPSRS